MYHILLSRFFLLAEFLILCIGVPGIIIYNVWAPFMFAFLWGATFYGLIILRVVYHDHLKDIWKWKAVTWDNLKPILIRWLFACVGMTLFISIYDPERLLGLTLERPQIVFFLFFLYPFLSALPQEFIFCSFFFERYRPIFGNGKWMVIGSALVFAYAHCLYINPVAPTLSLLGGLIFALTYLKTRSLALVTIEHSLYGNFLFIIGLGWYFYGGSVVTG